MKLSFSKREKILGVIFIITIAIAFYEVLNKKDNVDEDVEVSYTTLDISESYTSKNRFNQDIIIKIENEIKNIVTIKSIAKYESSTSRENIQICIGGKIDNILKLEEKLKSIGIEKNIKKIEIVKDSNIMDLENRKLINDYVECILEIEVI
ncbi:MAG: hypothetical protein IJH34_15805 [Romboutsia sp.]|nr:hypothetical protein [Romboutsia sp.]